MSVGIKTPKRWGLTISNTTFVNFDLNCVAIRTCSGCSQGQGKFEQMGLMVNKTRAQVSMTNSDRGHMRQYFLQLEDSINRNSSSFTKEFRRMGHVFWSSITIKFYYYLSMDHLDSELHKVEASLLSNV